MTVRNLRVLDLTHVVAGPTVTQILADMGAEVIKVEPPPRGEIFREADGFGPSAFLAINRGKKSAIIDLKKKEGLRLVLRLASRCDVLVENLSPEAAAKIGLNYLAFKSVNPRIVYCKITGFGAGPYEEIPAWDPMLQAASGIMSTTGTPPDNYARAGISLVDMTAGFHAAIGILGALIRRNETGPGAFVEVSMLDAALYYMNYWMIYRSIFGKTPGLLGTSHFFASPYGLFDVRGGRVYVAITNDNYWTRFCKALAFRDLAENEKFSTAGRRVRRKRELEAEVARRLEALPLREVLAKLAKEKVPHARMNDVASLLSDPVVLARRILARYSYGGVRPRLRYETFVNPVVSNGRREYTRRPPPSPGEQTEEILTGILGLSHREVGKLRKAGVVA